jgi:hypothetical protein
MVSLTVFGQKMTNLVPLRFTNKDKQIFQKQYYFFPIQIQSIEYMLTNYLCISTYSMSPEKLKNSVISLFKALNERLLAFTVLTCKKNV